MQMKLILREDVPALGKTGDVVDVRRGYGRNFLVPRGFAIAANPGVEDQAKSMRRSRDLKDASDRGAAEEIAKRIGSKVSESDVDRRQMSSMALGELGKLALYRGSDPVTVEDVRALVAEAVPDSIWALTDAVACLLYTSPSPRDS